MRWISFLIFYCMMTLFAKAQAGYAEGDVVKNFTIKKMLNYPVASASFSQVKQKLTIIDFFGTWCVPCIKALPHLTQLQQQYKDDVRILLVSNEGESKLKQFIAARKDFIFPLAADEDNTITASFQPPSYPYTVVVNETGKVLAVTEAAEINEAAIRNWLAKRGDAAPATPSKENNKTNTAVIYSREKSANAVVRLSQDLIYTAKTGESITDLTEQLNNLNLDALHKALPDDNAKKAFWINVYNAFSNALLKKNPEQYTKRNHFFKTNQIAVGGIS